MRILLVAALLCIGMAGKPQEDNSRAKLFAEGTPNLPGAFPQDTANMLRGNWYYHHSLVGDSIMRLDMNYLSPVAKMEFGYYKDSALFQPMPEFVRSIIRKSDIKGMYLKTYLEGGELIDTYLPVFNGRPEQTLIMVQIYGQKMKDVFRITHLSADEMRISVDMTYAAPGKKHLPMNHFYTRSAN